MFQWSNLIIVALTQKCNMNCKYCYLGDKSSLPDTEMSFATYKVIINQIALDKVQYFKEKGEVSKFQVLLHGGEPTLISKNKFKRFLEYGTKVLSAYDLPFEFSVQTNGINLDRDLLQIFKDYDVHLGISIDGCTNNLRDAPVDQKLIIDHLNLAKEMGIKFGIVSVFTSLDNKNFLDEILTYNRWMCVKVNKMEEYYNEGLTPPPIHYFNDIFIPVFKDYISGSKPRIYTDLERIMDDFLVDVATSHSYNTQSTCKFKFCGAGTKLISIMPNGLMHICDHWRGDETFYNEKVHQVGTFDFLTLQQFKASLHWIQKLNPLIKEKGCDNCIYSIICLHECPLANIKSNGKWLLNKKDCELTKMIYDYLWEHLDDLLDGVSKRKNNIISTTDFSIYGLRKRSQLDKYKISKINCNSIKIEKV